MGEGGAPQQLKEFLKALGAISHNATQHCSHISQTLLSNLSSFPLHPPPHPTLSLFHPSNQDHNPLIFLNLLKLPPPSPLDHLPSNKSFARITNWISRRQSHTPNSGNVASAEQNGRSSTKVEDEGSGRSSDGRGADIYFSGKLHYEQVEVGSPNAVDDAHAVSLSDQTSFTATAAAAGGKLVQGSPNGEKYKDKLVVTGEVAIQEKAGGAVSKEELGRASWIFLHTLAAQFPDKPTRQQQRDVKELMAIFSRMYPCKQCADHFKEILRAHPVKAASRSEFTQWMCRVHNIVNRSLGKVQFPCNRVDARWGALDCDEGACDLHGQLSTR